MMNNQVNPLMRIKRILRFVAKVIASLLLLIAIYLLAAWLLPKICMDEEAGAPDEVSIYILTNGVHTDIVMPARTTIQDWTATVPYHHMERADSTHRYLAVGWGDKGFYLETPTWADLRASVAFKAATGLSTSALHTTYYRNMKVGERCRRIDISWDQYQRLINYIMDSADTSADGAWIYIDTDANYGKTDAFYEAKGRYSVFHTCNTWANKALEASGQKHCLWTPFDKGIFHHHK